MRDIETIGLALTAAETGHLVWYITYNRSRRTVDIVLWTCSQLRKKKWYVPCYQKLRAVISQTLLKTADGNGRCAAYEIMIGTPAIRNLIRENKVAQMGSMIQTGQQYGMKTLDQSLTELVDEKKITRDGLEVRLRIRVRLTNYFIMVSLFQKAGEGKVILE